MERSDAPGPGRVEAGSGDPGQVVLPASDRSPDPGTVNAVEQRILAATHRLLAAGIPYTALSMRNIAVAAGIARSTAYRYFPRKNCLLIRLVDADTGDRFAPAERWWEHWRPGDNTGLTAGLAAAIEFRRRRGHLLAALAEVVAYDTLVARYHAGRTARMTELIVASLQQVHAAGDGPPPVVDPAVGVIVAAMVERTADLYSTLESPIDLRRIATALSKAVTAVATGI